MTHQLDVITPSPAIGLANLIGLSLGDMSDGDFLPVGFHILYFNTFGPVAEIGHDGHPKREKSLELSEFPRRMFAGARLEFLQPLRIGDRARREDVVIDRKRKEGSSGTLLFQRQSVTISNDHGPCLRELQTIVYRGESQSTPSNQRCERIAQHTETFRPDEVTLFRFSALSGNSHRIHYDFPYATSVEGYPALVVHGPLIALKLLRFAVSLAAHRDLKSFDFRAVGPLFLGTEARLCAADADDLIYLWVERLDGTLCMTAEAMFGTTESAKAAAGLQESAAKERRDA